jgi:hypothetical protein
MAMIATPTPPLPVESGHPQRARARVVAELARVTQREQAEDDGRFPSARRGDERRSAGAARRR